MRRKLLRLWSAQWKTDWENKRWAYQNDMPIFCALAESKIVAGLNDADHCLAGVE